MRRTLIAYVILSISSSCGGLVEECKVIQEWRVQHYKIEKKQCQDLVLAYYFEYNVSIDGKTNGTGASKIDSCIFTWQANNESFLTLNVCDNTVKELKPHKILLDSKSIDSVTIFSRELNQVQLLTTKQIEKLADDWNNSKSRGYSVEPFDSAFSVFPAYQYRLTVFFKETKRIFYGYNFLMLDSSQWEFEMSKTRNLNYFHNYWEK